MIVFLSVSFAGITRSVFVFNFSSPDADNPVIPTPLIVVTSLVSVAGYNS